MQILLTGGPHDGTEMEVPARTDYVAKFAGLVRLELHGYRATKRTIDGLRLFEHVGLDLESWDKVQLGDDGALTITWPKDGGDGWYIDLS